VSRVRRADGGRRLDVHDSCAERLAAAPFGAAARRSAHGDEHGPLAFAGPEARRARCGAFALLSCRVHLENVRGGQFGPPVDPGFRGREEVGVDVLARDEARHRVPVPDEEAAVARPRGVPEVGRRRRGRLARREGAANTLDS